MTGNRTAADNLTTTNTTHDNIVPLNTPSAPQSPKTAPPPLQLVLSISLDPSRRCVAGSVSGLELASELSPRKPHGVVTLADKPILKNQEYQAARELEGLERAHVSTEPALRLCIEWLNDLFLSGFHGRGPLEVWAGRGMCFPGGGRVE
jgi:hypothetical protein